MLKRLLDIIIASSALIILSPLYLYVAYKVRKNLGSPLIFRQVRPGLHGRPFEMIKFRTMTDESDAEGNLLPNEQRLPKFGKMLRATSLDEMPELWNVIKGDMSIVGPRPLLMDYLPLYNEEQAKRHNVRPGMTGYAQVNGRNSISWEEKFKLDTWYVENQSIWLDFKIMFQTVKKVLVKEGINQSEEVTMTRFMGNKKDEQ
ncbi:putative sugar transferase EpsL [Prolinoborus fasciculus]|uniref:sugar transferase n=1 Tax=Acinetobacter schindleri TaxID=108981 RepID=UPI000D61E088|nr:MULTISPECIES: sugar transferase [Pseudomonadota]MBB4835261.1 lipopolysaccharide/colanic/teichoic acid biosynthesis glycosyltransferase [Acinetobacter schindleri]SPJ20632.1 putative sugar transferase EpsL [Prolinoborus fasciculus]